MVIQLQGQVKRNPWGSVGAGLGLGLGQGMEKAQQTKEDANKLEKRRQAASEYLGMNLPKGMGEEDIHEILKQAAKYKQQQQMIEGLGLGGLGQPQERELPTSGLAEGTQGNLEQNAAEYPEEINVKVPTEAKPKLHSQDEINKWALINPTVANNMQRQNDNSLKDFRNKENLNRQKFESDRKYHTEFSKKAEEEAESIRRSLPKKEMSLTFARDAIENGDVSYFSKDKLADATGSDLFRTAKGAQLVTAGKENLLSNMSRVTGKAQNMWFEQRLNSMFPKIGQSKEANLTVQEMLEGELALDQAYLNEFDKIAERDMQDYGYVKKDISKRANDALKPIQKDIMQRTTYRMKEIEEQEKGLKDLKSQVGKNVSKGTPFTLAMAKLYTEKFGDNAIDVARKNGYYIPTIEEFKRYRTTNQEMLEGL